MALKQWFVGNTTQVGTETGGIRMPWWYYLAGGIAGLAAVLVLLF